METPVVVAIIHIRLHYPLDAGPWIGTLSLKPTVRGPGCGLRVSRLSIGWGSLFFLGYSSNQHARGKS